jgi:hypothetical protein
MAPWRRPPMLHGRLPPPPGRRNPPPLDCCDNGAAARQQRSPVTATMLMSAIDIGVLFIGWEDREGDNGSGVAAEDDDDTDTEAGGYAHNFLEVVLCRL